MGQFGDKFRKAREAKNISLDDVSNVTKIGTRMLRAIEEEHFDQLPGGVFNKGFVRAYAKHLGLNDEEAVTDYLACLRQAQIDAHEVWDPAVPAIAAAAEKRAPAPYTKPALKVHPPLQPPAHPPTKDQQGKEELAHLQLPRAEHVRPPSQKYLDRGKNALPWRLIAAFAAVVILAAILWIRHSRTTQAQLTKTTALPTTSSPAAPPAASVTPAATTPQPTAPQPASGSPSHPAPAATQPPPTKPTTAPASSPAKPPANSGPNQPDANKAQATPATTPTNNNKDDNDVTVKGPVAPKTQPTPAPTMTLVIRASETSWISVTADGQIASQETLIAPAHASIRASREIVARIGNAAGVTFLWNGQEIPAQGAEAEVKTFIFDAQGMREAPNNPAVQNR